MALFDCAIIEKCCSVVGGRGVCPLFSSPPRRIVSIPGNLPSKAKKALIPGGGGAERSPELVNLSKDVFERRTSTRSGLFSFFDSGFAHLLGQVVSIIVKTLRNTNLGASRCFKTKKTSLPVDVRRSKTPLLKLPID